MICHLLQFNLLCLKKYRQTYSSLSDKYFPTHLSPILLLMVSLQTPAFALCSLRNSTSPAVLFLPSFRRLRPTENHHVLPELITYFEKKGNGLSWLSLKPEGTTVAPVVLTSLIQNSSSSVSFFAGKVFMTVRCSDSDFL